jgi:hypothetical protein
MRGSTFLCPSPFGRGVNRERRLVLILLAGVALAGIAVILWRSEREPEYRGKKLSEWLKLYKQPVGAVAPVVSNEAADAVRHIGTNGLPFLLKWMREEQEVKLPRWEEWVFMRVWGWNVNSRARNMILEGLAGREFRAGRAIWGFIILGPKASPAVPDLVRMARSGNVESAKSATLALGYLGKNALQPLLTLAGDWEFPCRGEAMVAISDMRSLGTNAHPAVVFLLQMLKGPADAVGAADILGRLGLESELTVPALTECLQSTNAVLRMWGAISLGRFGERARGAVPELSKVLNDPDDNVRREATNALGKIAPESFPHDSVTP